MLCLIGVFMIVIPVTAYVTSGVAFHGPTEFLVKVITAQLALYTFLSFVWSAWILILLLVPETLQLW